MRIAIPQTIISGWEMFPEDELDRIDQYPCVFCYSTEISYPLTFEQETAAEARILAGIKVIDEGSDRVVLEKLIYRYTDAIFRTFLSDMYLCDSGYEIIDISKVYSATEPREPLIKAGMVSLVIKGVAVYA